MTPSHYRTENTTIVRVGETGSLLVITLWVVTILTVLVVAVARHLSLEVRLAKYRLAHEQAKALARSGVYLAMERLARDANEDTSDWLGDDWASVPNGDPSDPTVWVVQAHGRDAQATGRELRMHIIDEERKLNLNTAAEPALTSLTGLVEVSRAIIDHRDPPKPGEDRPDDQPPYVAKNGPFAAPEELLGLPGMTAQQMSKTYETLRSETTPYLDANARVNINTAGRDVLVAIGLPPADADQLLAFREGHHYFKRLTPAIEIDDPTLPVPIDSSKTEVLNALSHLGVASQTFTITATGRIEKPRVQHRVVAVIRRSAGGPPRILAWREG